MWYALRCVNGLCILCKVSMRCQLAEPAWETSNTVACVLFEEPSITKGDAGAGSDESTRLARGSGFAELLVGVYDGKA